LAIETPIASAIRRQASSAGPAHRLKCASRMTGAVRRWRQTNPS
jgi:hypothetical protein